MSELKTLRKLQKIINKKLYQEEKIIWIDQPIPKFFTIFHIPVFFMAILCTVFYIFLILLIKRDFEAIYLSDFYKNLLIFF